MRDGVLLFALGVYFSSVLEVRAVTVPLLFFLHGLHKMNDMRRDGELMHGTRCESTLEVTAFTGEPVVSGD